MLPLHNWCHIVRKLLYVVPSVRRYSDSALLPQHEILGTPVLSHLSVSTSNGYSIHFDLYFVLVLSVRSHPQIVLKMQQYLPPKICFQIHSSRKRLVTDFLISAQLSCLLPEAYFMCVYLFIDIFALAGSKRHII